LLFVIFLIANVIALIYAILISQGPLIIKYTIAIETTLVYIGIFAYFHTRKKKRTMAVKNREVNQGV